MPARTTNPPRGRVLRLRAGWRRHTVAFDFRDMPPAFAPSRRTGFDKPFCFAAVILAAGRSLRMGRPKLLLPWGETSVLGHLISQWQRLGAGQVAVVCASGDGLLAAELDRLGFPAADRVTNPAPERGMFSSIQCAAGWDGWRAGLTHWAIVLGDQPHLRLTTLQRLLALAGTHPGRVCQPACDGERRHPVLLPRSVFHELAQASACHLKEFLAPLNAVSFAADDPGLDLDLDRPEDYRRAKGLI